MIRYLVVVAKSFFGKIQRIRNEVDLWWFKRTYVHPPVYDYEPVAPTGPNDLFMLVRKKLRKKFRMPSKFSILWAYWWAVLTKSDAL